MSEPGRNEQETIAQRAYEIWEAEGRPHGRHREHWEAAARELGSPTPMPADYKEGKGLAAKKPARRMKADVPAADATPPKPARSKRTPAA